MPYRWTNIWNGYIGKGSNENLYVYIRDMITPLKSQPKFNCPFTSCHEIEFETSHDLLGHVVRSHLQLLIYRDPISDEKKSMYGCPFCNETFLWVGIVFSAHLQEPRFGNYTKGNGRSWFWVRRWLVPPSPYYVHYREGNWFSYWKGETLSQERPKWGIKETGKIDTEGRLVRHQGSREIFYEKIWFKINQER